MAFRGIKVPLEVTGEGVILDGHHRNKAALELGLATVFRRHLMDNQWVAMAVKLMKENPAPTGKASPN